MGDAKFILVTRILAQLADRRTLATAVAALWAGGPLAHGDAAARQTRCVRDGRRCGPDSGNQGGPCKRCCSDFARFSAVELNPDGRRRCACRPDGMGCQTDGQCCQGVCDPATNVCDDGKPGDPPIVCDVSEPFCSGVTPPNCGGTTKCWCATTNSDENFCTSGQFSCASNFGTNITCNDDSD
jgi:hypothetical protein